MLDFNTDTLHEQIEARYILLPLTAALKQAGIPSAISDARCLLGIVLGRDDAVLPHEVIARWEPSQNRHLDALRYRRQSGEPISRLRGWREFWSMRFEISPATLDPRSDSETLIEAATVWARTFTPSARILDLGTGSGCLLLACLAELPQATGTGIDISAEAVDVAISNARHHGLADRASFYQQDFGVDMLAYGHFDLILANPPYIPSSDIKMLEADVRHFDPLAALDGGPDGLSWWRVLCPLISRLLSNSGMAFVEIGAEQGKPVVKLSAASGLVQIASFTDLSGRERCLQFQKELPS